MFNVKNFLILSLLLAQTGCSSVNTKDHSSNTERVPANDTKVVTLIGFERSVENIQSEEIIEGLIVSLQNQFRYCYERELTSNPGLQADFFFYFGVTQKGLIRHVSSDTVASTGKTTALSNCISAAISKTRSSALNQDLTFRARLRFQAE